MLSIPQKVRILRFAAEQGVVSLDDVARFLRRTEQMAAVRTALHESGLSNFQYGSLKLGIWHLSKPESLELLHHFYPDLPPYEIRPLGFYVVDHALEINRIRLTLEESNKISITQWWSENYIRALPALGMRLVSGVFSDSVFFRQRADKSQQKFFLEYEKTFKNIDRYKRLFKAYSRREDVKDRNIIYICKTLNIKQGLEQLELKMAKTGDLPGAGLFFQFILLSDFYKTYTNQKQEDGNGQQTQITHQPAHV